MRKIYEAPAMEVITFAQEDVLGPSAGGVTPPVVDPEMQGSNAVIGNSTGMSNSTTGTVTNDKVSLW